MKTADIPARLAKAVRDGEITLVDRGGGFFGVPFSNGLPEALVSRVDIDTYEIITGHLRLSHLLEHLDERKARAS